MEVLKQVSSVELLDRLLGAEDPLVQALVEKELRARLSEASARSNGSAASPARGNGVALGRRGPRPGGSNNRTNPDPSRPGPNKDKPWELIPLATWKLGSRKPYKPSAKSAHRLVHRLVKKGWLAPPWQFRCQACHQAQAACYSVKDQTYVNPLAVYPTCRPCSIDPQMRANLAKKAEAAGVTRDTSAAMSNGLSFFAGHLYGNLAGEAKGYEGPSAHSDFVPPDDDLVTYGFDVDVLKAVQELSRLSQSRVASYCISFQKGLHKWFEIEPY